MPTAFRIYASLDVSVPHSAPTKIRLSERRRTETLVSLRLKGGSRYRVSGVQRPRSPFSDGTDKPAGRTDPGPYIFSP
jgi:hypothetical protein